MDRYQITFETYNKIAALYEQKFMNLDLYNDTYDTFCKLVNKPNAAVLEIGCGPGNITKYLLSKMPDFKLTGIDVAPNMIELAKKNNPSADFRVMDCREINQLKEEYNAIICGFCMPYLSKEDCAKLIKDCSALLRSNDIFYFSIVEDDYNKSGFESNSKGDKIFFYYHQLDYLQAFLSENHFVTETTFRKDYPKGDGTNSCHLIVIARKINTTT
ncbi:class I SAM-dependent methyltransferase [Solitalea sp. MAHUQ-68]|uniref:Class I SAM-dependent methyltransferase n=1 Tax=Solitalea agri TaxID=2953739 RepID=A0A9X2JCY8_9SPHI|nr:class I SAM-dependent methyltransferase [Solitalea agri]MCO4293034.1 class I SAM-dependent methyltransferase [Solitalea agri]